jgi:hypothetical protein
MGRLTVQPHTPCRRRRDESAIHGRVPMDRSSTTKRENFRNGKVRQGVEAGC